MSVLEHFDPVISNLGVYFLQVDFFFGDLFFFLWIFLRSIFFKLSVLGMDLLVFLNL